MPHNNEQLAYEVGFVRAAKQYLLKLEGLPSLRVHDIITDKDGKRVLVTALEENVVEAMILDQTDLLPGAELTISDRSGQFAFGDFLFGRVISALGDPLDGKSGFPPKNTAFVLESEAPGMSERKAVTEQLITGTSLVDTVLPIGKGQRQLLMGPVRSGIDIFLRETIRNQEGANMVCIYAAIGRPATFIQQFAAEILSGPAKDYTIIVAASSDDPTPIISITPSVALLLAEHFRDKGRDVLLILDDLYTHAKYLREIGLLQGRLPGRESYPGDIFYQQAHLIERAGNYRDSGCITLLPVLQTDIEGYTDLITTNIMGTTDGHLLFSSELFGKGDFPSIVPESSVTRVGRHTHTQIQKQLSTACNALLNEYREQEKYTHFGAQVSEATQLTLLRGLVLQEMLRQEIGTRYTIEAQALLLGLVFTSFITGKNAEFFKEHKHSLEKAAIDDPELNELRKMIRSKSELPDFLKQLEGKKDVFEKACQSNTK